MLEMIRKMKRMEAMPAATPPAGTTSDSQPEVTCDEHGRPCSLFCYNTTCHQMLCASCPIQEHSGHKLISVGEKVENRVYFDEKDIEVRKVQEELEYLIQGFEKNRGKLTQEKEDIWKQLDQTVNRIIREAERLKQRVEDQVEKENNRITEMEEKVKECVEKGKETMSKMNEHRETSPDNVDAFQMQTAHQTLNEFKDFTAGLKGIDTSCEIPSLDGVSNVRIGQIVARKVRAFELDPSMTLTGEAQREVQSKHCDMTLRTPFDRSHRERWGRTPHPRSHRGREGFWGRGGGYEYQFKAD